MMSKFRFLLVIIIGLLLSNSILLIMFIKEAKRKDDPKKIIIDKLHFDQAHIKQYEVCIQQHRKAINENEATMHTLRSHLFEQLTYQQDTSKTDSLIEVITKQQAIAEKINYNHFLAIKALCKTNQIKDFNKLTTKIPCFFSSRKPCR